MDVSMSTVLQLWNQLAVKTFFGINLTYLYTTATGTKLIHLLTALVISFCELYKTVCVQLKSLLHSERAIKSSSCALIWPNEGFNRVTLHVYMYFFWLFSTVF